MVFKEPTYIRLHFYFSKIIGNNENLHKNANFDVTGVVAVGSENNILKIPIKK